MNERKTNKCWYPFKEMGSYFRVVDGVLRAVPMLADGTMELIDGVPNAFFVDYIDEDARARMDEITRFLVLAE